jgi:hypothetical protein
MRWQSHADHLPAYWSGRQAMRMHAPPGGVQIPQLELQQTVPGGQTTGPHNSLGHNAIEHGTSPGIHTPPQAGQQVVPARQSMPAHGLGAICTQMPEQSAPPRAGSQVSRGSSTQVNPGAQGTPARPPHCCSAGVRLSLRLLRRLLRRSLRRFSAVTESTTMESPRLPRTASRPRRLRVIVSDPVLGSRVTDVSLLHASIDEGRS